MRVAFALLVLALLYSSIVPPAVTRPDAESRPAERGVEPEPALPSQPAPEPPRPRPVWWPDLDKPPAVPAWRSSPPSSVAALGFGPSPGVCRLPPRGVPPVLDDVIRRLPNAEYWRDQSAPGDLVTWTHEGTHGVSARATRVDGVHSIYCLEGRTFSIRHPRLTIGQVAASIPEADRGEVFKLYLIDQRRYWDREPIYLVEEWVCYVHGTLARRQLGLENRGETEVYALEMEGYCRAMLDLSRRLDPKYPDAAKLSAFIEWNAARFRDFLTVKPGKSS